MWRGTDPTCPRYPSRPAPHRHPRGRRDVGGAGEDEAAEQARACDAHAWGSSHAERDAAQAGPAMPGRMVHRLAPHGSPTLSCLMCTPTSLPLRSPPWCTTRWGVLRSTPTLARSTQRAGPSLGCTRPGRSAAGEFASGLAHRISFWHPSFTEVDAVWRPLGPYTIPPGAWGCWETLGWCRGGGCDFGT